MKIFVLAPLAVLLVACGGGGDDSPPTSSQNTVNTDSLSPTEVGIINIVCFVVSLGQAGCFDDDPNPESVQTQETTPGAPWIDNVTVAAPTVTIDWRPPTHHNNGTILTDLAGIIVYWGPESGIYTDFVVIENLGIVTYVLTLPPGIYYIGLAAFDSQGIESPIVNETVVTIEAP